MTDSWASHIWPGGSIGSLVLQIIPLVQDESAFICNFFVLSFVQWEEPKPSILFM